MKLTNPTLLLTFHRYAYIIPQFEYLRWYRNVNVNIDFLFFGIRFRMHGLKNIDLTKDGEEMPF
jgi:hypothetical protein